MSKTVVIYYSFEGNTKFIAEYIAKELGADILALKPKKEIGTHGFMKYVWGGKQAVMKKTPELEGYDFDAASYDKVIFGSPVWVGTFTPPLRTFLSENEIKDKKVAFFCCHEGGKGKVMNKMQEILEGDNIYLGGLDIASPLVNEGFSFDPVLDWLGHIK